MLAFFRRLINSKVGLFVTFLVLGMIALAFASGDVSSLRTQGMAALAGNDDVAIVGSAHVSPTELRTRATRELEVVRQQQPTVDMAQFIGGGGLEGTVERVVTSLALQQFGQQQGMLISKRAVDGEIASIPELHGPTGEFDPAIFRQLLAQRKLSEADIRADLAQDLMTKLLTARLLKVGEAPEQLAVPYANLSLEKRVGEIAFVPTAAMPAGTPPTDAELQAYYARNIARYTIPERRVIRYALVTPDQVKAKATPSETEIAQAYARDRARYAATEHRAVTRVVVLDQIAAQTLAAKVKAGQPLIEAARAAGLEASTEKGVDKATLAQRTSPAVADAVFAAARGAVIGPVKGGLGFTVAKIDAIEAIPGRTLAQAHDEVAATLTKTKTTDALNALHDAIDDKLAGNATFDEVIGDQKLAGQTSAPLLADGANPDQPDAKPEPALAPVVRAAFAMQDGDEPQMVTTGTDGSFALVALGQIASATPRPLAQIRARVAQDVAAERARQAARRIAGQMLAAVNKGQSFSAAWSATKLTSAGPRPLAASRDDVQRAQGPTRAPLALMFAMAPGTAKLLEAPGGSGWALIRLTQIIPGNAAGDKVRISAIRGEFSQLLGNEIREQFARAARAAVGVKINQAAVAKVKADLLGNSAQ